MHVKYNEWYAVKRKDFGDFIQGRVMLQDGLNRVSQMYIGHSQEYVLFLSLSKTENGIAIHYRSNYNPAYMNGYIIYDPIGGDKCAMKIIDDTILKENLLKNNEELEESIKYWQTVASRRADMYNGIIGAPLCENIKEKVMDMNKTMAIRGIIESYVNDCEKEYRAQYEAKVKLIKADDVIGDVAKQLQDIINKNKFERNMIVSGNEVEEILVYSKITDAKIKAATSEFDDKITNLHKVCREAENLCALCDTYEQMRQVLADYEIIPNTKKRGK